MLPSSNSSSLASLLGSVNLLHPLDRIGVFRQLIRTQSYNSWKAQGVSALVTIRPHDVVESDFQNDLRLDLAPEPLVIDGVLEEPLRHLGDFGVGQSRIRFPYVHEPLSIAHRKGVIAQNVNALAMPPLYGSHHHIQCGQFPLHLEP